VGIVNDYDNLTVFGWMINKLGLEGCDLLVYAKIFGEGQDGGPVKINMDHLSTFIGYTADNIINSLRNLVKRNLIIYKNYYRDQRDCYIVNLNIFKGAFNNGNSAN